MRGGVSLALATCAGWLGLHELHTIVASSFGQDWLFHRFDHAAVLFVAAAAGLLACRRARGERVAWAVIGLGVLGWATGEAVYTTVLWNDARPPIPSPLDAGYLLFPSLLLAGLAILRRRRPGRVSATRWAGGPIAGLAVSALSAALVFETLYRHVAGDAPGVGVALASLTDMVMLAVIAGGLARTGWKLRGWGLLAGGVFTFWLADSLYAVSAVGDLRVGRMVRRRLVEWLARVRRRGMAARGQPVSARRRGDASHRRSARLRLHRTWGCSRTPCRAPQCAGGAPCRRIPGRRDAAPRPDLPRQRAHASPVARDEAITDPLTWLGNRRALAHALEDELAAADDDHRMSWRRSTSTASSTASAIPAGTRCSSGSAPR
jgi:hypothetical protein